MIGIGLSTTPNRTILKDTFPEWQKYLPKGAKLIIENDTEFTGVSATKNRLLSQLHGCDHIFLADDDVKPLVKDWYLPYINASAKHLLYQFKLPTKPSVDMQEIYRDDKIVSYTHTRGAFIYIHRDVLNVVGGFDEAYTFGYEHVDYSNRIHNAGLTAFRAMDVVDSDKLLYCYDQDSQIESSVPDSVRRRNLVKHRGLYHKSKTSREYKEFR